MHPPVPFASQLIEQVGWSTVLKWQSQFSDQPQIAVPLLLLGSTSLLVAGGNVGDVSSAAKGYSQSLNDMLPRIRGGSLDLERTEIRLGGLEMYSVIASIVLGAVLDVYGDTPQVDNATRVEKVAQSLQSITVCIGFLAALYTIVIFSLFGLYAKTALGVGNDDGYQKILSGTERMRFRGFLAFSVCLCSFNTSFLINVFLNHRGSTRWTISAIGFIGTFISIKHFLAIMRTASEFVFGAH